MHSKIKKGIYFLFSISLIYLILFIVKPNLFSKAINFFNNTIIKIIPLLIFVFILMLIFNYFIEKETIKKQLKSSKTSWIFAILGGILSVGAIYIWYPLLKDMKSKGLSNGAIACFLYNKAIKLQLLPLMIYYFGIKYVFILTTLMIIASLIQGAIINKLKI